MRNADVRLVWYYTDPDNQEPGVLAPSRLSARLYLDEKLRNTSLVTTRTNGLWHLAFGDRVLSGGAFALVPHSR
jgi:hypothetical protein